MLGSSHHRGWGWWGGFGEGEALIRKNRRKKHQNGMIGESNLRDNRREVCVSKDYLKLVSLSLNRSNGLVLREKDELVWAGEQVFPTIKCTRMCGAKICWIGGLGGTRGGWNLVESASNRQVSLTYQGGQQGSSKDVDQAPRTTETKN